MNGSPWLTALSNVFDPLLRSSIQAGLLILIVLAIRMLLGRRLAGRWLYALWMVVMIRMALPWAPQVHWSPFALLPATASVRLGSPSATPEPGQPAQLQPNDWALSADAQANRTLEQPEVFTSSARADLRPARQQPAWPSWHYVIYGVWLAGILVLSTHVLLASIRLWRRIARDRRVGDPDVLQLLEECRQTMGIRTPVGLVVTNAISSPALFGWTRPSLLLPAGVLETLNRQELRHVFLHELAHLRRHDVVLGWFVCVLQILHWCNPLVWVAASRMRADRELACDALALSVLGEDGPQAYGNTVLRLLQRFSSPRYLPALTGILEDKSQIRRRVAMIARYNPRAQRTSAAGLLVVLALGGIALTDAPAQTTEGRNSDSPAAATEPAAYKEFSADQVYTILPGTGLDIIRVGATRQQVEAVFGTPESKDSDKGVYRLVYHAKANMDFLFEEKTDQVLEIRFNKGFKGATPDGIAIGTPLRQVLDKSGGVKAIIKTRSHKVTDEDRVLYEHKNWLGIINSYKFIDGKRGILYWFDSSKRATQIVVFETCLDENIAPSTNGSSSTELPEGSRIDEHGNIVDRIDWPFVNDPAVLGKWESVAFVENIEDFQPDKPSQQKLFLKGMVLEEDGKASYGFSKWTKGKIIHEPDKTASAYTIKEIDGQQYMFREWKSGDYIIRHERPAYYVLKKLPAGSPKFASPRELFDMDRERPPAKLGPDSHIDEAGHIVDKVDYPFVDDPDVIGTWKSVDFVREKAQFQPDKPTWRGDLHLKELVFEPGGTMGSSGGRATWTKGLVLHQESKKAPAYDIIEKNGEKYMFYEWKSGDYTVLHRKPAYYVLKKVEASEP